jgi:hypothetical protein
MPASGEIGSVAEHTVSPPCHNVCDAGIDQAAAPRAGVGLLRLNGRDGLHSPL